MKLDDVKPETYTILDTNLLFQMTILKQTAKMKK